jgi:hypothetical protein
MAAPSSDKLAVLIDADNAQAAIVDLPPNDVHFFGLKKGYVQIITSGLSSVLACGQRGAP